MCVGKSSNKITPGKNKDARWQPCSIWRNEVYMYSGYVTGKESVHRSGTKKVVKDTLICHYMTILQCQLDFYREVHC